MVYHVGVDVHDYEKHTHGRKEVYLTNLEDYDECIEVGEYQLVGSNWVEASEYGIELVQSQHPLASVELAYVKEFRI